MPAIRTSDIIRPAGGTMFASRPQPPRFLFLVPLVLLVGLLWCAMQAGAIGALGFLIGAAVTFAVRHALSIPPHPRIAFEVFESRAAMRALSALAKTSSTDYIRLRRHGGMIGISNAKPWRRALVARARIRFDGDPPGKEAHNHAVVLLDRRERRRSSEQLLTSDTAWFAVLPANPSAHEMLAEVSGLAARIPTQKADQPNHDEIFGPAHA